MTEVRDIKDRTPNRHLVERLEAMLEQAKSGELRTLLYVSGFSDDYFGHSWVIDDRNSTLRMVGATTLFFNEVLTNEQFRDSDSVLSQAFTD